MLDHQVEKGTRETSARLLQVGTDLDHLHTDLSFDSDAAADMGRKLQEISGRLEGGLEGLNEVDLGIRTTLRGVRTIQDATSVANEDLGRVQVQLDASFGLAQTIANNTQGALDASSALMNAVESADRALNELQKAASSRATKLASTPVVCATCTCTVTPADAGLPNDAGADTGVPSGGDAQ